MRQVEVICLIPTRERGNPVPAIYPKVYGRFLNDEVRQKMTQDAKCVITIFNNVIEEAGITFTIQQPQSNEKWFISEKGLQDAGLAHW